MGTTMIRRLSVNLICLLFSNLTELNSNHYQFCSQGVGGTTISYKSKFEFVDADVDVDNNDIDAKI